MYQRMAWWPAFVYDLHKDGRLDEHHGFVEGFLLQPVWLIRVCCGSKYTWEEGNPGAYPQIHTCTTERIIENVSRVI
jgi:hypothetical protein